MQVELRGFRSHTHSVWTFDINVSNYVRGDNGSGKSDIYRAITWAIYGENTKTVYQAGNKSTVVVKLWYQDVFIRRQANSHALMVKIDKKKSDGLDAQANLIAYFGTSEKWHLASYITQNAISHNFVMARPEERMNVINRLIGNDEGIKTKMDALLRQAKVDIKIAQKLYERSETAFKSKYGDHKISLSHCRSTKQLTELETRIESSEQLLVEIRTQLNKQTMLQRETNNLKAGLIKLSDYTPETYATLKDQRAAYVKYLTATEAFARHNKKFSSPPPFYTQEDYKTAILNQDIYTRNTRLAAELEIDYDATEIEIKKVSVSQSIEYSEQLNQASAYRKQARVVKRLNAEIRLQPSALYNIDLEAYIQQKELSLQYISAFDVRLRRQKLQEELNSLPYSLSPDEIEALNFNIENQWIFEKHVAYNKLLSQLPPDTLFTAELLTTWRQELRDAEESTHVMSCPGCDLSLCYQDRKLTKYGGRVLRNVNIKALQHQIRIGEQLYHQKPPDIPSGLIKVSAIEARKQIDISQLRELLAQQLEQLTEPDIPDGVENITNVSQVQQQIRSAKALLKLQTLLLVEQAILDRLPNPEVPEGVARLSDITAARDFLNNLAKIVVIPQPINAERILESIEWHKLHALLPESVKKVQESTVEDYNKRLAEKDLLTQRVAKLEAKLAKFEVTEAIFTEQANQIQALQVEQKRALIYAKVTLAKKCLAKEKNELAAKQIQVGKIKEYRQVHLKASKTAVNSTIHTTKLGVNTILRALLQQDITVDIAEHNNNLKVEFYKNGINHGDPKEMSGGEGSVLSLALVIVFNKLVNSKILMLDEATEGLMPSRKDDCIEYLVDYTEKAKKTLIITDHSCHTGDYTRIINVGK